MDKLTTAIEAVKTEEPQAEEVPEATGAVERIRPEFKQAMDNYEEFYDEYIAFMKEYTESPDASAMAVEYISMT